jgi:hypothetical protein
MALTQTHSGSASIGATEYDLPSNSTTLSAQTTAGIYQLFLDLANLTATERYRLRIYERTRAGDPQRVVEEVIITGAQTEPIYVTPALALMHGWTYTLQRLQGTDRAIGWSIRGL